MNLNLKSFTNKTKNELIKKISLYLLKIKILLFMFLDNKHKILFLTIF